MREAHILKELRRREQLHRLVGRRRPRRAVGGNVVIEPRGDGVVAVGQRGVQRVRARRAPGLARVRDPRARERRLLDKAAVRVSDGVVEALFAGDVADNFADDHVDALRQRDLGRQALDDGDHAAETRRLDRLARRLRARGARLDRVHARRAGARGLECEQRLGAGAEVEDDGVARDTPSDRLVIQRRAVLVNSHLLVVAGLEEPLARVEVAVRLPAVDAAAAELDSDDGGGQSDQ